MEGGVDQGETPSRRNVVREETSTTSEQGTRRPSSRGAGIRGLSGPTATLYALAFRAWGTREEDRRQYGDEGRGSPPGTLTSVVGTNNSDSRRRGTAAARRPASGPISRRPRPALALTRDMCATYSNRNPSFRFTPNVPRRVLTVPSEPAGNDGMDNAEFNFIARVNDILEVPGTGTNYSVLDLLGQGTFGQVFRCQDHATKDIVAIKVVKNKPAYQNQAMLEIQVAKLLNETYDPNDTKNIVRLKDCFQFKNHLCLVFELLSINLYELLKQNQFRGLPLPLIRHFIKQILEALQALEQANVIHCDLKPENVLLMNKTPGGEDDAARGGRGGGGSGGAGGAASGPSGGANRLKVIDFGSACFEGQTMYSYIQSRFYRSPEVLLGLPYDGAIDIWSLGCISVELFLGLPIFPGVSDHNQICRIVEMTGSLPDFMLENGKDTLKFFKKVKVQASEGGGRGGGEGKSKGWRSGADMAVSPERDAGEGGRQRVASQRRGYRHVLKTPQEYARDTGTAVPQLKKYFKHSNIPDIVQAYPLPGANRRSAGGGNSPEAAQEKEARRVFTHFVIGLLNPNPWKRWTPKQAASHPFITGQPHPRDLGALTIADDPLVTDRYTRHRQAMHLQYQKDQREAERKRQQRIRQQQRQQQQQQQEKQQREQRRGMAMAIPGASSSQQSRGLSSMSGPATPVSMGMGNHAPYHASPLHHARTGSGDCGLMAMQIAHTPQGSRGGEDYGLSSMSRPIDVPAGSGGGGGMGPHSAFSRVSPGGGGGGGGGSGHDLLARSMGYTARGGAGTSYPPPQTGDDDAEVDSGRAEAYSYSAASFSMGGGASGNFVASDFGYALQRPGLRYEPTYKQSPPVAHSSSHAGAGSLRLNRRRVSDIAPGGRAQPGSSFGNYHQQGEGLRGHERGGRALSMDQSQGATLQYYISGGGVGGHTSAGGGGRFGPQASQYPMQQSSSSVSALTAGPPGYSPLARGTLLGPGPPSAFRSNAPQANVPWVRAGRGIGHGQPLSGAGPRAQSTSPLFGRPPPDFPSSAQQELGHVSNPNDMHLHDSSVGGGGGGGGGGGDTWIRHVSGAGSEDLAGSARQARHAAQRGHRQDNRRGAATDPDMAGEGVPFAFQLDDGRLPPGGGGPPLSSSLDWMGGEGVDDAEGVHKRSLNGTSKGVSPAAGVSAAGPASPRDEGDLIHRDSPGTMRQQLPQAAEAVVVAAAVRGSRQGSGGCRGLPWKAFRTKGPWGREEARRGGALIAHGRFGEGAARGRRSFILSTLFSSRGARRDRLRNHPRRCPLPEDRAPVGPYILREVTPRAVGAEWLSRTSWAYRSTHSRAKATNHRCRLDLLAAISPAWVSEWKAVLGGEAGRSGVGGLGPRCYSRRCSSSSSTCRPLHDRWGVGVRGAGTIEVPQEAQILWGASTRATLLLMPRLLIGRPWKKRFLIDVALAQPMPLVGQCPERSIVAAVFWRRSRVQRP
ncbi:Dual-specificity tyrosine-phosphorylation regulated kinase [Ectocarpus siliculosus]|uniref:Dual-specificity tyrosine-phosphorylation regulated kinase n=1 Tax=Ectocarpus siliculosus TaxID=2880 RepID=D7G593_ECTSI|nr:Dual-specificity tyrosine-phosphorylation regulated kinase [Ectocarpus siliculosus]|eukprot:CBJ27247.1 Dual-specificity tyrosine-phosphorylation regulated kinase [Ectocarpus siliculosus]